MVEVKEVKNETFEDLKEAVKSSYRTDGMTLPAIPPFQDEDELKWMLIQREAILNPDMDENTVIKKDGTTLKEQREALNLGKMPKNAPKEAKEAIGKHTFSVEMVDGVKTVVVKAPEPPVEKPEDKTVVIESTKTVEVPNPTPVAFKMPVGTEPK